MVEQQPSKLNTRVRFPSPAPSSFNNLARILDLIPTTVKVISATSLNTFPILPMFSLPRTKILFQKRSASPQQIGSGELDDLVGTPVENGLQHVKCKTLRHLRSYFRRHRQLHAVDDRIDEHRTGMSQGLGELRLHLCRILDAHALDADGLSHGREVRIDKLGSGVEKAGRLLFELDEAERTIVEHDYLHGELELRQAQKIAHQHGESTVAGQRDHLALRESGLRADCLRHRIRHGAVPERSHQT